MPNPLPSQKPVIQLCRRSEEELEVRVDDVSLGQFTHDSVGWDGMAAVENLVTRLAAQLGLDVVEADPPEDD